MIYTAGSYLRREKTKEMKRFFVYEEESKCNNSKKCSKCSLLEQCRNSINQIATTCTQYYNKFVQNNNSDGSFDCINWTHHLKESEFSIEEVDVEE